MNYPKGLSLPSWERCFRPLVIFVASSGLALASPWPLGWLKIPKLDAMLQVGLTRAEGDNHLPPPAGCIALDAAQDTTGILGCKGMWLNHIKVFVHKHLLIFLIRASLNPFSTQIIFLLGIVRTQVQGLTTGCVEQILPLNDVVLEIPQLALSWTVPRVATPTQNQSGWR